MSEDYSNFSIEAIQQSLRDMIADVKEKTGASDEELGAVMSVVAREFMEVNCLKEPKRQVQTSGPQCKKCGAFTTYARVDSIGLCMKCDHELEGINRENSF